AAEQPATEGNEADQGQCCYERCCFKQLTQLECRDPFVAPEDKARREQNHAGHVTEPPGRPSPPELWDLKSGQKQAAQSASSAKGCAQYGGQREEPEHRLWLIESLSS